MDKESQCKCQQSKIDTTELGRELVVQICVSIAVTLFIALVSKAFR
jgi:hypothetical protein